MAHDASGTVLRPTLTISASPDYAAGDVVGGIVTLTGALMRAGGVALLRSLTLKDATGAGAALSLLFFRASPSGGTYTDNAALVFGSGDLANLIGVVRVVVADWYIPSGSGKAVVGVGGIDVILKSADTSADLYLLIVADAAYNAAATSDLSVEIGLEQR